MTCPDCGVDLYFSGHDHEECPGQGKGCQDCGWGCDLDFAPAGGGFCAALDEDDDTEGLG